jgi:hypothetical protein
MAGIVLAQQTEPPKSPSPGAQIVQVRIGEDCGRCGGKYYASEISFEPALMVSIHRSRGDKKDNPDTKTEYKITKQEWEELQHLIDARVLAGFRGRIGCPGCADEGMEWAEVEFSDGTKKSVSYSTGKAPTAIEEMLKKIHVITAKYLPRQNGHNGPGLLNALAPA